MVQRFALAVAAFALAMPALFAQDKKTEAPKATLNVGMPAPALEIEKWLKGSPVASFEKGKVYVVEFWATWCGPCIAMFPHLSALQADYKDRVTVIGTNIWEDRQGPYDDKTLPKVETFLANQGDRMAYAVAYDGPSKAMDKSYMKAAARRGIPSAFIVDGQGVIAWMGHPGQMDYALSEIVAGTWDIKSGPERESKVYDELKVIHAVLKKDASAAQAAFDKFSTSYPAIAKYQDDLKLDLLKAGGQWETVYAILTKKVDEAIARKDSGSLNQIAWGIVDPDVENKNRNVELALRAALKADEFTGGKDPAVLDTVARCHATKGDMKKAIEVQMRAIESAQGKMKESLEKTLDEYKAKGAQ